MPAKPLEAGQYLLAHSGIARTLRLYDLMLLQQVRRLLECEIAHKRGLHVLFEGAYAHRFVKEAENLRIVDEMNYQLRIGIGG